MQRHHGSALRPMSCPEPAQAGDHLTASTLRILPDQSLPRHCSVERRKDSKNTARRTIQAPTVTGDNAMDRTSSHPVEEHTAPSTRAVRQTSREVLNYFGNCPECGYSAHAYLVVTSYADGRTAVTTVGRCGLPCGWTGPTSITKMTPEYEVPCAETTRTPRKAT